LVDVVSTSAEPAKSRRTTERYLRVGFAVLLALLAWHAFRDELGSVPLLGDIDLAIHEFGHMLFMPFGILILGRTMMILGGSLTQVAFPLIFVGYFLKKNDDGRRRDLFAAMVCVWWSGINLLDVAIYCADSRAGQLMLLDGLTGQESDGHDWYNLLSGWGLLEHDVQIARVMRAVAAVLCAGAIVVAVWSQFKTEDRGLGPTASTIAD
jgi:predicted membrane-bound mannosyltransferase